MPRSDLPPRLDAFADLLVLLWEAATAPAHKPVRRRSSDIPRRNCTLRPGSETPLWNQLVKIVRPMLRQRGAKAQLGRILALPRQRVHDFFVKRIAAPDAERTLLLLAWIEQRRRGRELG